MKRINITVDDHIHKALSNKKEEGKYRNWEQFFLAGAGLDENGKPIKRDISTSE